MKKLMLLTLLTFVCVAFKSNAQTGKEIIEASIKAMRLDKLDSFKTFSLKASMYAQGQKVSTKIYSKSYGEGENKENKTRFEQSAMGKEAAYVIASEEDEFYQLVPTYEELDISDAGAVISMFSTILPTSSVPDIIKDTVNKVVINLVGTADFNGKKCNKISMAAADKPEEMQYLYFDEATNWIYGVEVPTDKTSILFDGMKRKKSYVYPTVIKIMSDGKKQAEVEVNEFEVDIELDDALFNKPGK